MKPLFIILLLSAALQSPAQNAFRRIHNKVAASVEAKAGDRLAEAATEPLDKKDSEPTSNNTGKGMPAGNEKVDAGNSITTFSKYDFIPGDRILYAHDFAGEAIGELPMGWNTDGMAEVVTINQYPGNWLQLHQNNTYLTSNTSKFGDNYTLEFDLILNLNNTGYTFPYLTVGVIAANPMAPAGNSVLANLHQVFGMDLLLRPASGLQSYVSISSFDNGRTYYAGNQQNFGKLESYYGKPVHVAMQVQKERLRIWLGEQKVFDAPKVMMPAYEINQLYFKVSGSSYQESQVGIYLGNIKVATGVADNRSELATKGKFTTKGIRFEFQKSDILPESYPVIKEIAGVLKENPGMKIRITGHTSNDGDAAANLELSKQRAIAIKAFLVNNFQIEEGLLLTDGKGGTQPADKGITPEAKANNRRVEFIKV